MPQRRGTVATLQHPSQATFEEGYNRGSFSNGHGTDRPTS
jgi:hypothetical protein